MLNLFQNKRRILGMNARNLLYIHTANKKKAIHIANDKLQTKEVLLKAGIPIADLYASIKNRRELLNFSWNTVPSSFVLKPVHGLGGQGIIVIFGKQKDDLFITSNDQLVSSADLTEHTSNILDGNFSFSNIPDNAFIEQRLRMHPEFKNISWQGMPDIRIIVFNNVPVMAMLRLPTRESNGKANLHQGGIGVGIDLSTGTTTYATQHDKLITKHPDTNTALQNFTIPDWDNILTIAIKAQQAIGLGYSGVDIVIDRDKGPVVLEVNGHPGLSIQNANLTSLRDRLDRVMGLEITSVSKGLAMAKELFRSTRSTVEDKENKKILGFMETVTIAKNQEAIRAKIDTGLASTTMNHDLAIKLGFEQVIKNFLQLVSQEKISVFNVKEVEAAINIKNDPSKTGIQSIVAVKRGSEYILRPKVKLSFCLKKVLITTEVAISRNEEISYPLIIGRRDLKNFLIDPTKALTK
jgi:alpha-L-glutamate ligase-like protein